MTQFRTLFSRPKIKTKQSKTIFYYFTGHATNYPSFSAFMSCIIFTLPIFLLHLSLFSALLPIFHSWTPGPTRILHISRWSRQLWSSQVLWSSVSAAVPLTLTQANCISSLCHQTPLLGLPFFLYFRGHCGWQLGKLLPVNSDRVGQFLTFWSKIGLIYLLTFLKTSKTQISDI